MVRLLRELGRECKSTAEFLFRLLTRINVDRVRRHGVIYLERGRKWLQRRLTRHPTKQKFPVFIVGCNRSGTQMACRAIGNSPHCWDYPESQFSIAFVDYHLRPKWLIKWLTSCSPAPILSFGCILDSQSIDDNLTHFKGARAIWVYRRYEDAANSCVRSFGDHFKTLMRWVARGEVGKLGPRGERVSADVVKIIGEHFREDLTNEDSACLYWYMRNRIYFDLNLDKDPRVFILQYEDAVLDKENAFRRVFDFLGFPYHSEIVEDVFSTSVGKHPWSSMDPKIREICDDLKAQLDTCYTRGSND